MNKTFLISYLNIEVLSEDLPELYNYPHAIAECEKLGDGWRLPTFYEVRFMSSLIPLGVLGNLEELSDSRQKSLISLAMKRYGFEWDYIKGGRTEPHRVLIRDPESTSYERYWLLDERDENDRNNLAPTFPVGDYKYFSEIRYCDGKEYRGGESPLARVRPVRDL